MGCYINPANESKEAFLNRYGKRDVSGQIQITETHVPVCLIDNGLFTAAMVFFHECEIEAMKHPSDRRPKTWYMVPRVEVRKVSDLALYEQ